MNFGDAAMAGWRLTISPLVVGLVLVLAWPTVISAQMASSPEQVRIIELEAEVQRQRAIQAELRRELSRLQSGEPAVNAVPLAESIAALRAELTVLGDRTGNRSELESANQRLTELNAQLRQEVETLALELQTLRTAQARSWLLYGAGLLLAGLLAGVSIKARPRRSAWS